MTQPKLKLLLADSPGGLYNPEQMRVIAQLAEDNGHIVQITDDQRLGFIVSDYENEKIKETLTSAGMRARPYGKGVSMPVWSSMGENNGQDALAICIELDEKIRSLGSQKNRLRIGINGSSDSSGSIHTLDIAAIGDDDGFKLYLGGKNSLVPELGLFAAEQIPASEISDKITEIAHHYIKNANPGESLHEYIERTGMNRLLKILAPYSQDAGDSFLEESETHQPEDSKMDSLSIDQEPMISEEIDMEAIELDLGAPDEGADILVSDEVEMKATDLGEDSSLSSTDDLVFDEEEVTKTDESSDAPDVEAFDELDVSPSEDKTTNESPLVDETEETSLEDKLDHAIIEQDVEPLIDENESERLAFIETLEAPTEPTINNPQLSADDDSRIASVAQNEDHVELQFGSGLRVMVKKQPLSYQPKKINANGLSIEIEYKDGGLYVSEQDVITFYPSHLIKTKSAA